MSVADWIRKLREEAGISFAELKVDLDALARELGILFRRRIVKSRPRVWLAPRTGDPEKDIEKYVPPQFLPIFLACFRKTRDAMLPHMDGEDRLRYEDLVLGGDDLTLLVLREISRWRTKELPHLVKILASERSKRRRAPSAGAEALEEDLNSR